MKIKKWNIASIIFIQMKICVLIFLWSISCISQAKPSIQLTDPEHVYVIDSSYFQGWDPVEKKTFETHRLFFKNEQVNADSWYTFQISNPGNESIEWYMVSYNYGIDKIDLISVDDEGRKQDDYFRDTTSVYQRTIQHKQPVFFIRLKPGQTKTYYLNINNETSFNYVFAIYSHQKFFTHFFMEYILYGIFYGFLLFVLLYSLMHYILLREKVVLFYCLLIASQFVHMLFRDGNGLFLLLDYTEHADLIKNISRGFLCISLLMYTTYFLKIDIKGRLFKFIIALIIFRIIYMIVMLRDTTMFTFHIEMFFILFCTYLSIRSYKKNKDTRYMAIGLIILSISYFIFYCSINIVSPPLTAIGFFGIYYGVAGQCIFMTLALTERFKRLKFESYEQQQMNKELEQMVEKRTELIAVQNKQLEERSEELNLFLYSASHDLKGPLKTIEGLCNIGIADKDVSHVEIYGLIKNKLKNLEANISDLNLVTKLKNENLSEVQIDFDAIHAEIVERFRFYEGFSELNIYYTNTLTSFLYADLFSIKCIYQNIFENALKYRDSVKGPQLHTTVSEENGFVVLNIQDNGLGISEKVKPKIFEMFYRGNEKSQNDTGLGLFIVKLAVEKLQGRIEVESEEGKGTSFTIFISLIKYKE
ncbi:MAG: 7TM diverse intracellular signaling domain-containing protein [Cytophaga sp.]|uniref:7TM diverse intracellular signaling domain-containing protein n=1 Tax=Cytophaga sp. TaxID=29535 RepID=UPI003F7DA082